MTNIDNARVYFNFAFELSGNTWSKAFSTKQNDSGVKNANRTDVVECDSTLDVA